MRQDDGRIQAVADAAQAMQDVEDLDRRAFHYAAGVEDALRWVLGDVSGNVFHGFSPDVAPISDTATGRVQS